VSTPELLVPGSSPVLAAPPVLALVTVVTVVVGGSSVAMVGDSGAVELPVAPVPVPTAASFEALQASQQGNERPNTTDLRINLSLNMVISGVPHRLCMQ